MMPLTLAVIVILVVLLILPRKPSYIIEGKIIKKDFGHDGIHDSFVTIKTPSKEVVVLRFDTRDSSHCYHINYGVCFHGCPGTLCVGLIFANSIKIETLNQSGTTRKVNRVLSITYDGIF